MMLTDLSPIPVTPTTLDVPLGRGRVAALHIDDTSMTFGDRHIDFDAIRSIAYATWPGSLNLVQQRIERHIRIADDRGDLDIALGIHAFGARHEFVHHQAYGAITSALYVAAEPRLRAELLRSIASGSPVHIGSLVLDSDGVGSRSEHSTPRLAWTQLPVAEFRQTSVAVSATVDRAEATTWSVPMMTPNAALLPELLIEAAEAFA